MLQASTLSPLRPISNNPVFVDVRARAKRRKLDQSDTHILLDSQDDGDMAGRRHVMAADSKHVMASRTFASQKPLLSPIQENSPVRLKGPAPLVKLTDSTICAALALQHIASRPIADPADKFATSGIATSIAAVVENGVENKNPVPLSLESSNHASSQQLNTYSTLRYAISSLEAEHKVNDVALNSLLLRYKTAELGIVDSLTISRFARWKSDTERPPISTRQHQKLKACSRVFLPYFSEADQHWSLFLYQVNNNRLDHYDSAASRIRNEVASAMMSCFLCWYLDDQTLTPVAVTQQVSTQ